MKSRTTLFLVAAALMAGSAAAATPFSAGLASPKEKRERVIADSTVWICEGASCVATNETRSRPSVKACRRLAREVGVLTSYSAAGQSLSDADLAACNESAKK